MKIYTLVLLICAGLAHAEILGERCDMSSPGFFALELLSSSLEKPTVRDMEMKYKAKRSTSSSVPGFSQQEIREIGDRVEKDWCDFKRRRCYGNKCFTPNCKAEHEKMFLTFQMCAKNLKAFDFAKIHGFSGVGLEQFLNVTLVIGRRYYFRSNIKQGVYGTESWKLFERLVTAKYREAVKGTDFPLSKGTDLHNIKNKRAAVTCLLIALGADVRKGLAEYEKDGYSRISDGLVEKVFNSLLTGSIADQVLNGAAVRNLRSRKLRSRKLNMWKALGMRLKSIKTLPLCMDPVTAVINEMKVTCQLKNIAFESSDITDLGTIIQNIAQPSGISSVSGTGGKSGCTGGPATTTMTTTSYPKTEISLQTTTTMPMIKATLLPKTEATVKTSGMSIGKGGAAPSKGFTNEAAPGMTSRSGAAPMMMVRAQPAPTYIRS